MNFTFDWSLVPKEDPYYLGWTPNESAKCWFTATGRKNYWFAGYGKDGERNWTKLQCNAMTLPSLEEATKLWNDLNLGKRGFVVGGASNTTTFKV